MSMCVRNIKHCIAHKRQKIFFQFCTSFGGNGEDSLYWLAKILGLLNTLHWEMTSHQRINVLVVAGTNYLLVFLKNFCGIGNSFSVLNLTLRNSR